MATDFKARFGATARELGERLGVSKQRISQLQMQGRLAAALRTGSIERATYDSKYRRLYGCTICELSQRTGKSTATLAKMDRWAITDLLRLSK